MFRDYKPFRPGSAGFGVRRPAVALVQGSFDHHQLVEIRKSLPHDVRRDKATAGRRTPKKSNS
jgi:hypothetical protein